MHKKKIIIPALIIFLLVDFAFSFLQYYDTPLYGDIEGGVLPDKEVQQIFDDPFGFHVLTTGDKHINPNRFFSHWFLKEYLQKVPGWLQNFVSPIDSVYLASALLKLAVQIAFVFLLSLFISGKRSFSNKETLYCMALLAPLFQVYGYWSRMGIVDKSIAYTFFYAVPLVFLMLFFLPFFRMIRENAKFRTVNLLYLVPLMVLLPLSGPLIPGIILIVTLLIFVSYFTWDSRLSEGGFWDQLVKKLKMIPIQIYLLVPISLWSLYSLFLGRYDSNYFSDTIPVFDRFLSLPIGLYRQIFHSLGYPLMLILIGINMYFIQTRFYFTGGKNILRSLKWIGIFAAVYVLLLPLGGYRPYRPYTIRYDTFMPVTVAVLYIFGASSWFLLHSMKGGGLRKYQVAVIAILAVFEFADTSGLSKNDCERQALETLANSKERIVRLPNDCTIMSWGKITDYHQSEEKAELFQYWGIIKEKKLFYQGK